MDRLNTQTRLRRRSPPPPVTTTILGGEGRVVLWRVLVIDGE